MNAFSLFNSSSGEFSAIALPSNVLVHSAIDPVGEAESVTASCVRGSRKVLLIGNGLGYLAAALSKQNMLHTSIELYPDLAALAQSHGIRSADSICTTDSDLHEALRSCPIDIDVMIAPYVLAIRSELSFGLAEAVAELHVTLVSQKHYRSLIDWNTQANASRLAGLRSFDQLQSAGGRIGIALGSGPTLDAALEPLHELRSNAFLVAASGAVPVLSKADIAPDLIVAMEARNTIVSDLEYAEEGAHVLVFPWTHPGVLQQRRFDLIVADESRGIFTHGGSTGLAAADIAAKLTCGSIFLIGMEMSDAHGEYAANASRVSANLRRSAPKFVVMRSSTANWVRSLNRRVYHMIMPGCEAVHGASALFPVELRTAFLREQNFTECKSLQLA